MVQELGGVCSRGMLDIFLKQQCFQSLGNPRAKVDSVQLSRNALAHAPSPSILLPFGKLYDVAMQNGPLEDVCPIEHGDFPLLCFFTGL